MSAVDVAKLWELLPSRETLDAVDDDLLSGRRPCPLYVTINDVRALHKALDALAASERDAKRYRWLRDSENYPDFDWWMNDLTAAETAEQFDAAIDAAMPQEPNHE